VRPEVPAETRCSLSKDIAAAGLHDEGSRTIGKQMMSSITVDVDYSGLCP
jgi:uncharacterized protein (UPF0262 family)